MVLSDPEISGHVPPLISPYNSRHLRPASYDLTVGSEYLISESGAVKEWLPLEAIKLRPNQSFEIPPHAVCYVLCKEKITLPNNLSARVALRMTHINSGLMLAAQPPFDPNYDGFVIVMLHNLSNRPRKLKEGARVVTMEFYKVSGTPSVNIVRSNNVVSLEQTLSIRVVSSVQDLERKTRNIRRIVFGALTLMMTLVTVLVAIPAITTITQVNSLSQKVEEQKLNLDSQKIILSEQARRIERQEAMLKNYTSTVEKILKNKASLQKPDD